MKHDILPDLLAKVRAEFEDKVLASAVLKKTQDLLEKKKATYATANDYAIELGKILSEAFSVVVTGDKLPDGKMYYNIAQRLLADRLGENYELVSGFTSDVQKFLNEEAGIGLAVQVPKFNQDRFEGLVNRLAYEDSFDDVAWLLGEPIINFSQSIVDDAVRDNFKFQSETGLSPKIIRKSAGKCCGWCQRIIGVFSYGEEPEQIYHRHRNCRCTVEYFPAGLKSKWKQNAHSKKWKSPAHRDRIAMEQEVEKERSLNNVRLQRIALAKAKELGMNPLSESEVVPIMRVNEEEWKKLLTPSELKAIEKYTFNGKDPDGMKLFEKINGYLANYYVPQSPKEEEIIQRNIVNIQLGLLKNKAPSDIIVYRTDALPHTLIGEPRKFISTSVTQSGAFNKRPNIAILVPKGAPGAYLESISPYKEQTEFLLDSNVVTERVFFDTDLTILKVVNK